MRKRLIGIVLAGAALAAAPGLWAQEKWRQGVSAFKGGDYRRALGLFERELQSGNESAKLKYNIGVTLMKLGRYREAGIYFQMLLSDPEWRDIARFNLALAAERQNLKMIAAKHYRKVSGSAGSQKLRRLAADRLNALAADGREVAASRRWLGTASLSAGYDDNAYALQNALLGDSSASADSFTELFAWGQYQLSGAGADGWRLHGYGFGRRYSEFDSLNLASASVALSRDRRWLVWQVEAGAAAEVVYLGGEQVTRQAQFTARLQREFGQTSLSFSYIPSYYTGGDGYSYLDGWRQRFEAAWQYPLFSMAARTYYRYDANDREDLLRDQGDFYSYSPVRHSFGGVLEWRPVPAWSLSAGVEYRRSTYDGSNRVTDPDGNLLSYRRESERIKSWFATRFRFTPSFSLSGKLVVIDNEENRELYTYDKSEATLGISYIF
ncbi:hypothetical protein OQJ59_02395 [Microbulbifer thermotolerans]|uniref:hypothetical protein n=1 Tax=Microbulbifer thermotolerans TaxID=252514 RepID=UPI00224A5722|nr:hypothetical protein [Microbulbifer thermotolerans]MCX2840463.1 hypothetical protein [Microbulbifer thermotolerans]